MAYFSNTAAAKWPPPIIMISQMLWDEACSILSTISLTLSGCSFQVDNKIIIVTKQANIIKTL